jgi:hypothetical protein
LTSGYHLAFFIGAGLVVVAIAVALTVLKPERQAREEPRVEAVMGPGWREPEEHEEENAA